MSFKQVNLNCRKVHNLGLLHTLNTEIVTKKQLISIMELLKKLKMGLITMLHEIFTIYATQLKIFLISKFIIFFMQGGEGGG